METINNLAQQVHQNAKNKGFYDNGAAHNMGERLALTHSEVSEALEADRNGMYANIDANHIANLESDGHFHVEYKNYIKGNFEEEMADIVIRVMDMCAFKNIDLEAHIKAKMRYNSLREHKHGKKY